MPKQHDVLVTVAMHMSCVRTILAKPLKYMDNLRFKRQSRIGHLTEAA